MKAGLSVCPSCLKKGEIRRGFHSNSGDNPASPPSVMILLSKGRVLADLLDLYSEYRSITKCAFTCTCILF